MYAENLDQRWWQKRRWRLAVALWLVLPSAYPLALGPIDYVGIRGWLPMNAVAVAHWPWAALVPRGGSLDRLWAEYDARWVALAARHGRSGEY